MIGPCKRYLGNLNFNVNLWKELDVVWLNLQDMFVKVLCTSLWHMYSYILIECMGHSFSVKVVRRWGMLHLPNHVLEVKLFTRKIVLWFHNFSDIITRVYFETRIWIHECDLSLWFKWFYQVLETQFKWRSSVVCSLVFIVCLAFMPIPT